MSSLKLARRRAHQGQRTNPAVTSSRGRKRQIKMQEIPVEIGESRHRDNQVGIRGNRVLLATSRLNKIAVKDSTAGKGRLVSLVPLNRLGHGSTRGNSLEGLDRVGEVGTRGSLGWL